MKKNSILVFCVVMIMLITSLAIKLDSPTNRKSSLQAKNLETNQKNPILTPDQKSVLGSSTKAGLTTYTSQDGGYTLTYPAAWTPSTLDQIKNFDGDISVYTIGPVGQRVLGYPSFIQIAVDQNPQGLSIEDFAKKIYGDVNLSQTTIGSYSAEMTSDVSGPVHNTIFWTEPNQKIYQIRFYDGVEPKISQAELHAVLQSFQEK